jgi:glucosamine-6-phosphate deaminase
MVIEQISIKPDSVFVLATGNTPLGLYAQLAAAYRRGDVSFRSCSLIELDDYWGIPLEDHRNLYNWLHTELITHVDFLSENITRFNTEAANPAEECLRVDLTMHNLGKIDLVVFGLGPNGHLGFNEPGSDQQSPTRIIELTPASIASSAAYWGSVEEVPRQGVTLGLSSLLAASKILLIVSGKHKAKILKKTLYGPVTTEIPASYLQQHPNLTVIADQDALSDHSE